LDGMLEVIRPGAFWTRYQDRGLSLFLTQDHELRPNVEQSLVSLKTAVSSPSSRYTGWVEFAVAEERALEATSKLPLFPKSKNTLQYLKELEHRAQKRQELKRVKQGDVVVSDEKIHNRELYHKLFPHQRVALHWLLENDRAFLGDDMGLGKTLTVLAAFSELFTSNISDLLVVVCPASLTRNWLREAQSWTPELRVQLISGEKKEKEIILKRIVWGAMPLEILILNFELVRTDYALQALQELMQNRKVTICIDESQRVKNPTSKSFYALKALTPLAARRILLSGTPAPRDVADIWSQIFLLDDGERFGTKFYPWLEQIAELGNDYSDYAVKSYRPEEVKRVVARVQEILLRRKKEDVLNLPEKLFTRRYLSMSGDQRKLYEMVRKELRLKLTSLRGDSFYREITNLLEEYLRAVQIASNPRLIDENWKGEPVKFVELDAIVDEIVREQGKKIVIWTNYIKNINELALRYAKFGSRPFSGEVAVALRDRTVKEFQTEDKIKVLVANPACGGVGITLTAAQTAVYIDKTWNAEYYMQSVDRIHRIGQTGSVTVISLLASKVDELIQRNLERKKRFLEELLGDREVQETLPSREELLEALEE
jgi:SWI/SNF-related matrix-associated actin-dependent regulator 1 of chromatin subfamily A